VSDKDERSLLPAIKKYLLHHNFVLCAHLRFLKDELHLLLRRSKSTISAENLLGLEGKSQIGNVVFAAEAGPGSGQVVCVSGGR
jgi:hypothetical protein